MKTMRATLLGCVLATTCFGAATANTIKFNTESGQTRKWTVNEVTNGQVVSAPAVYVKGGFGDLPGYITVPFTNCDGYWRASRRFNIPAGATNLVLRITELGVDDRAVIKLNGAKITAVGTLGKGKGDMQFHDPGHNVPYYFPFLSGPVSFKDTTHLRPGVNEIKVIVNNTNNGINGTIVPVGQDGPSYFGIVAKITYTP